MVTKYIEDNIDSDTTNEERKEALITRANKTNKRHSRRYSGLPTQ
jgi:hypothetical protein